MLNSKTTLKQLTCLAGLAALLLACSSGNSSTGGDDAGTDQGQGQQTENLETCTDCVDFVIDRLLMPVNTDLWRQFSRDMDGDGTTDNALGQLVTQVLKLYSGVDVQQQLDDVLNEGGALVVLRLKSEAGLVDGAQVKGQLWIAEDETCCQSADRDECAAEAEATCFSGDHTFTANLTRESALASGTIAGNTMTLDADAVEIVVKLFGEPTTLRIRNTVLEGKLANGGIADGKLTGVIDQSELLRSVVSKLTDWLNGFMADPTTSDLVKSALGVLDTDGDGTITLTELTSGILKNIFAGDVDIDGDGTNELSVGFGFSAVGATINTGNPSTGS